MPQPGERKGQIWPLLRVDILRAKPTEKAMCRHLLVRPNAATVLKKSIILLTEFGNPFQRSSIGY
jgi:hypothetical protein